VLLLLPFIFFNNNIFIIEVNGFGVDVKKVPFKKHLMLLLQGLTRLLLLSYDYVYVVNNDLKRRLVRGLFKLKNDKVIVVNNAGPNPFDTRQKEKQITGLRFVLYTVFHQGYDYKLLFESIVNASSLSNTNIQLDVIGFGYLEDYVEKLCLQYPNVNFLGGMDPTAFARYIKNSEQFCIGVVPLLHGNGSGELHPIKAFEYLALGMPILYSDSSMAGVLTDNIHGKSYIDGDVDSCTNSILWFAKNTKSLSGIVDSIFVMYKKHTWHNAMQTLYSHL